MDEYFVYNFIDRDHTIDGHTAVIKGNILTYEGVVRAGVQGMRGSISILDALTYAKCGMLEYAKLWGDVMHLPDRVTGRFRQTLWVGDISKILIEYAALIVIEMLHDLHLIYHPLLTEIVEFRQKNLNYDETWTIDICFMYKERLQQEKDNLTRYWPHEVFAAVYSLVDVVTPNTIHLQDGLYYYPVLIAKQVTKYVATVYLEKYQPLVLRDRHLSSIYLTGRKYQLSRKLETRIMDVVQQEMS